jgi:curved DNA-binding protein CbpA
VFYRAHGARAAVRNAVQVGAVFALQPRPAMDETTSVDFYEVLQVNPSAEPETVHRVYRMLAQRYHPDNQETGNESRFRELTEAYHVISDPERRAQYDLVHDSQRRERWRLAAQAVDAENDFAAEQRLRATVLELLYTQRRMEPNKPGIFPLDLEKLTGRPREHLEFTVWFLVQKKFVHRADNSMLVISAEGVEHLETTYHGAPQSVRRLRAVNA